MGLIVGILISANLRNFYGGLEPALRAIVGLGGRSELVEARSSGAHPLRRFPTSHPPLTNAVHVTPELKNSML